MAILLILYNIGLIILFTVVATLAAITYFKNKKRLYLVITLLFLFLILNNILIYLTEQLPWFSVKFNQLFMTTPSPKTILLVAHTFFLVLILTTTLSRKISFWQYGLVISHALVLLLVPMLPNNAFKIWIYYFPSDLVNITLASYGLATLKQATDKKKRTSNIEIKAKSVTTQVLLSKLMFITLIMTSLTIVEDSYVIFFLDNYTFGNVRMTNRSISEDILAIIYAITTIVYLSKKLLTVSQSKKYDANQQTDIVPTHLQFIETYHMTSREAEVLLLLLQNKNNQDISRELYISMGTVKSHIHNIFSKLNVTKRNQVKLLYAEYQQSQKLDPMAADIPK